MSSITNLSSIRKRIRGGVEFETFIKGFKRVQIDTERDLNVTQHHSIVHPELTAGKVKPQWILCILRDVPVESATKYYEAALPYKDIIVGISLDSNEYSRPPALFDELYLRARANGFKLTVIATSRRRTHTSIFAKLWNTSVVQELIAAITAWMLLNILS